MLRPTQVPNFQDMTDKHDMIYSFISLGLLSLKNYCSRLWDTEIVLPSYPRLELTTLSCEILYLDTTDFTKLTY
jgi:hypothetical protein